MNHNPVAFIDSGVGGLPYARAFRERAPHENLVYVADRAHFPYGPRSREDLSGILISLVGRLLDAYSPKLIVIACNSASVSSLEDLRAAYPKLPFVGTVPAIKSAAGASRSRKIGLLATARTVADPYIQRLMREHAGDCSLESRAAPELVQFVEHRYLDSTAAERRNLVDTYADYFSRLGVDAIVLACTHFLFLEEEFIKACGPDVAVFDSIAGVVQRALDLLDKLEIQADRSSRADGMLIATGDGFIPDQMERFADWAHLHFNILEGRRI